MSGFSRKVMVYLFANLGLFIIGLVIVYMFLNHALLYQLGLPALVVIGGAFVVITLRLILFFVRTKPDDEGVTGVMVFNKDEKNKVLTGDKTQKIIPQGTGKYRKGDLLDAKTNITDKASFGKIRIRRTYDKTINDLDKTEVMAEGFKSQKKLLKKLKSEKGFKNEITVVKFYLIDE